MTAIGEVLSASISNLIVQCWSHKDQSAGGQPVAMPAFGSFLTIESTENRFTVFAVTDDVQTGPRDSFHKPAALGLTREQLREQQPQIFSLLKTEIHAVIVGYKSAGNYISGLPPQPPLIHDFVSLTQADEIVCISESLDYIRILGSEIGDCRGDELLAAVIRHAYHARQADYHYLVSAGQALAHAFREDYDRLSFILRKIHPQTQPN